MTVERSLPGAFRNLFMAQPIFRRQTLKSRRNLDRVQVFPLDVLNQRELQPLILLGRPDQCWESLSIPLTVRLAIAAPRQ